ncbi:ketopantoate reductase family protein [Sphingobacterium sp. LRF_L2]|uniref:ketopantoate reductase family protein n=1 Tax=Sphingobacterium sp. LRF_L2 TaxID=3369421 RepID=UPI003F644D0B
MSKKILVVGIGAVGGYFGGMLAKSYVGREGLSVCFMARGENLKAIQEYGLSVEAPGNQFYAIPDVVSDDPKDFGKVDYIILCTKSYDIEETVKILKDCVHEQTVFLSLLNGVDSSEKIKALFPGHLVADGGAYILSRLLAPGKVHNSGTIQRIFFGVQGKQDPRLDFLLDIFKQAGIEAKLSANIASIVWEKFIFISVMATVTSFYNKNFGEIQACATCTDDVKQLIEECCVVAAAKNIALPSDVKERVWSLFVGLLPEKTTSMHADYQSGKLTTEVHSLTGYILAEGQKYNLQLPKYQEMYNELC